MVCASKDELGAVGAVSFKRAATAAAAEAAAHPTEEAVAEVDVEHVVEQAIGFPEATVEDADAGADRTEPATEA